MACPKCGCKVTYQFDDHAEDCAYRESDDRLERCSACGAIFDIEDHTPEDDDESNEGQTMGSDRSRGPSHLHSASWLRSAPN